MSLEASRFRLGLFFTLGSVMFVAAMIWLAGWFSGGISLTYACYFSESVQGLEEGSTVRYNGVPVGRVKTINVAPDGRLVEVVMEIEQSFEVRDDLAARLDMTGITGLRVVNLRRPSPNEEVRRDLPFESRYRTIPVVKSSMETLELALSRIMEIMSEMDAKRLSDLTIELLSNVNAMFESDSIDMLMSRLNLAVSRIDTLTIVYTGLGRNLNRIVEGSGDDVSSVIADFRTMAAGLNELMAAITPIMDGLDDVVSEGNLLTSRMRLLIERIRESPGDLLPSEPEGDVWP
ncbi:MAG TPA: MlaD family protein [Candidatus Fermentibacter daniensis]|jgi:ABC-type transporter Mla subunit MlaD|nr:MAG: hypothetical protein AO396_06065 [Candidatus Fermentibacter daniensis]MBP7720736.1 MCE family protein [Candidatus Fermentibacter sp.]OQC70105.1 MAG: mce related protein [candidate division Hyd24-12 bacterium ADurb.Bin004]KZD18882.1 MAG: hypothetical protein AO395_08885 [Candidatus Fermentibacter daniensis]KZD20247.1 MAG: hypothetical protein AO394_01455 [Candidatus Fermentibacter daniensis]